MIRCVLDGVMGALGCVRYVLVGGAKCVVRDR